jgi:hypothetical protein
LGIIEIIILFSCREIMVLKNACGQSEIFESEFDWVCQSGEANVMHGALFMHFCIPLADWRKTQAGRTD